MLLKKNLVEILEQKKFWWLMYNPKAFSKYNLLNALQRDNKSYLNLCEYSTVNWWVIRQIFWNSKLLGIGVPSYYTFGVSKRQKLLNWNLYQLKLTSKKDSWFFFGLVISVRNWFLNSTVLIRNVFYNEIVEKTFLIFNIWNILLQSISINLVKQSFFKKRLRKKTKLFFLWTLPRIYSKFILLN